MVLRSVAVGLAAVLFLASNANAQFVFANGDFELGIPDEVHQGDVAAPWYDYDGVNFWENAWQISVDAISPTDTAVLALSAFSADATTNGAGLNGYAYQSLGTAQGASSLTLTFDWGSFDDAAGPRDMGITFGIYEDSGGFAPSDDSDILDAVGLGVTLIDEISVSQVDVPISGTFNEEWTFDLSSAGSGELYLRINNFETELGAEGDEAWVFVDNIECDVCGDPALLTLQVDRDNGAAQFVNDGLSANLVRYTVNSVAGSIDNANWASLANSGGDPDDTWTILEDSRTVISEEDELFAGADNGVVVGPGSPLPIGDGVWIASPNEDFTAQVLTCRVCDGSDDATQTIPVEFIGNMVGGEDQPYMRSDFDLDNDIDEDDFHTFFDNHLTTLTLAEDLAVVSYFLGDLDGDLDNDVSDFGLFKADFIAANSAAEFAALLSGGAVPEPFGVTLVLSGIVVAGFTRVRAQRRGLLTLLCFASVLFVSSQAGAVVVSFSDTAPTPDADDVSFFITDPLTDVQNVYDSVVGIPAADGGENDYATYVALDRAHMGQTFTTGSVGGYLNAIWLQHAGYTGSTGVTWYNTAPGGIFQVRVTDPTQAGTSGFALADEASFPLTGLESNSFAPDGATNSPDGTGNWAKFTFENPIQVGANTSYGFDVTGAVGVFFETLGTSAGGYDGGEAYNGTTAAVADDILNPLVGDRAFLIEIGDEPLNPIATPMVVNIDPVTGELGITNVSDAAFSIDHYELRSDVGGMDSTNWAPLGANTLYAVDGADDGDVAGDSAGENWVIPGGVATGQASTGLLAEAFVLGATTINPNQTISLGQAYNTSVGDTSVTATVRSDTGVAIDLQVFYDGVPAVGLGGDFNGDGMVDAADYTVWRDNEGADESVLPPGSGDGSGTVDAGDYNVWRDNYGASFAAVGAASIPEPGVLALLACLAITGGAAFRRV